MNDKLLLQDLAILLAKKSGITQKEAGKFFRELFQLILEGIYKNDIVKIKDLGAFKLVKISSRESVDVNTGEKIEIPAHYKMAFTPDKSLKELINEPFAHFESVLLEDIENSDEKQEYNITDFAETVADNFKSVVDSISNLDDELMTDDDDDDDDLLEIDTDDFGDESRDLLTEETPFFPKTDWQENVTARKTFPPTDTTDAKKAPSQPVNIVPEKKMAEDAPEDTLLSEPAGTYTKTTVEQNNINQEEQFGTDQDDIEFDYIDYNKLEKESNKKKKFFLYATIATIAAFTIYQFAKLFDVTYDYEYYIDHVPPLTLSDSMRMIDEQIEPSTRYTANSDTAFLMANKAPLINSFTNEPMESNLDELTRQAYAPRDSIKHERIDISDKLHIKIANKAKAYLNKK